MFSDLPIAIVDFDDFLSFVGNAMNVQLNVKSLFVEGFQKTRAERTMNLDSGSNRPLAQFFILQDS